MPRVGPAMVRACTVVAAANNADAPITATQAAKIIGPGGDVRRGLAIIRRCVQAGMIDIVPSTRVPESAGGELVVTAC